MTPDEIDPNSENWKDGWRTRDAELGLIVHEAVRDELASLGGRLLATHGPSTDTPNDVLATLGGYLLEHYGGNSADNVAVHISYRDPEPPAVGEPPTTTPGT